MALSQNESFARMVIASFVASLNPTIGELMDIKTAVSEGVTNCIVHAYDNNASGLITVKAALNGNELSIEIIDTGKGIEDIVRAREPFYTSKPEQERSGMGFSVMESFMDSLDIYSTPHVGTRLVMKKYITDAQSENEVGAHAGKAMGA